MFVFVGLFVSFCLLVCVLFFLFGVCLRIACYQFGTCVAVLSFACLSMSCACFIFDVLICAISKAVAAGDVARVVDIELLFFLLLLFFVFLLLL